MGLELLRACRYIMQTVLWLYPMLSGIRPEPKIGTFFVSNRLWNCNIVNELELRPGCLDSGLC